MSRGLAVLTVQVQDPTAVGPGVTPPSFALQPNYPNPFNPRTTIRFTLDREQQTDLTLFDARGRVVRTLLSGPASAGEHAVAWDGCDESGRACAAGVYLARLRGETAVTTTKLTLVR